MDTLALLNEARDCFIGGHHIATLMLAVSFIEHMLSDEIAERSSGKRPKSLEVAIQTAKSVGMLDEQLLARASALRQIRNAFAHRKPDDHPHRFPNRYGKQKLHPTSILEADAKEALMVMHMFFRLTPKNA